jgi:hypothetical protein
VFTDPVVITGPVTNEELALRASIGRFVFMPAGSNERLIEQAGLALVRQEDVSDNAALIANRWGEARAAHRNELEAIEGKERFEGLQRFFQTVHDLTSQRRLSRLAYLVRSGFKRAAASGTSPSEPRNAGSWNLGDEKRRAFSLKPASRGRSACLMGWACSANSNVAGRCVEHTGTITMRA